MIELTFVSFQDRKPEMNKLKTFIANVGISKLALSDQ